VRDQRPISGTVLLIDGATVRGGELHGLVLVGSLSQVSCALTRN
jgi:hypothetical protein